MPQLSRGARQALDYLIADLNEIYDEAKNNPDMVRDLVIEIKRRIKEDIEPRLQRAAPQVERRLAVVEERLNKVEQRLDEAMIPAMHRVNH